MAQSVDALKDGKLDAFFWNGGLPTAAMLDLVNSPGMTARILPLDDMLPALQQRLRRGRCTTGPSSPRRSTTSPPDVPVVAVANLLVVSETMPEALATTSRGCCSSEQATLAAIHPQARELSIETATKGASIPFHPGAIRYYRERGVWTE